MAALLARLTLTAPELPVVITIPVVRCLIHILTGAVPLALIGLLQKLLLAIFAVKKHGARLVWRLLLLTKSAASTIKQPQVLKTLVPRPKEQSSPHAFLLLQFALKVSPSQSLASALVGLQHLVQELSLKLLGLPKIAITQ